MHAKSVLALKENVMHRKFDVITREQAEKS